MSAIKGLLLYVFVIIPGMLLIVIPLIAFILFGPPYALVLLLQQLGWNSDGTISLASVVAIFGGWLFLAWALFVEPGKVTEWVMSFRR